MKPLLLFLLLFLLIRQTNGQLKYGMLSSSYNFVFLLHPGRIFNSRFQYTSISATTGASTAHTFAGTSGSFLSMARIGDLFHGAYISHHHYFDLGLGVDADMAHQVNDYLRFGYGYIFRFGRLQVQPTLDFYWTFDGPVNMGSINNKDSTINLLGFTAKPQFTLTHYGRNGTSTTTYNASALDVDYHRNSFLAMPKVQVGTVVWQAVYIGLEVGWFLQLSQSTTIKLTQNDDNSDSNLVGELHLSPNGSLGGPEIALNLGYCLGKNFMKKKSH